MNVGAGLDRWRIKFASFECTRDAFGQLLSLHPNSCYFIDTCPVSVSSGKYSQFCHMWFNYRIFKWRNAAYITDENKYVDFVRTIWLYNETYLVECSLQSKARKKIGLMQSNLPIRLDDIEVVESSLRYSLRHELEEMCYYFSDMELLLFPMGTCILMFFRHPSSAALSFVEKIANVSGLYLRPHD